MIHHSDWPMSSIRLLLVDDDRLALATFAAGLNALGYATTSADSGEAGLALAGKAVFDLAILDIRMPGLSGIELCRILQRRHGLPSLFLSAYSEREQVAEAVSEGGMGYLVKPVDAPRAVPAIESALARARDLQSLRETRAQLEHALAGGRKTAMAIGVLMARQGLSEQAAFEALRAEARSRRRKLEDYCTELVAGAGRHG